MNPLGRRIDALRRERDWTWKALARRSGLHTQSIYKITHGERHDPRMSALVRLARAFGIGVDALIGPLDAVLIGDGDDEDAHAAEEMPAA